MKKLLITGNGFDLAHKIPSKFSDFYNFIINELEEISPKEQIGIVQEIKKEGFDERDILKEANVDFSNLQTIAQEEYESNEFEKLLLVFMLVNYSIGIYSYKKNLNIAPQKITEIEPSNIHAWNSLESALSYITAELIDKIYEVETESERGNIYEYERLAESLKPLDSVLERKLHEWIGTFKKPKTPIFSIKQASKDTFVLNFNYTETFIDLYAPHYKLNKDKYVNIHVQQGGGDNKFLFGHTSTSENSRTELLESTSFHADDMLYLSLEKNVKYIINETKDFWESIKEVEQVIIYGWSISSEEWVDIEYLKQIRKSAPNLKEILIHNLAYKNISTDSIEQMINTISNIRSCGIGRTVKISTFSDSEFQDLLT